MGFNKEYFKKVYLNNLCTLCETNLEEATLLDKYNALVYTIRDDLYKKWVNTNKIRKENNVKKVYYFSLEFLPGKLLDRNLIYLGIKDLCNEALEEMGISLKELEELEEDAALGNGGLGRLAACFLDSMASLQLPGCGCGIKYKYGLFKQKIINGYQVEEEDNWLKSGGLWGITKIDKCVEVKFGGNVKSIYENNKLIFKEENYHSILAEPYDVPVLGYKNEFVNTLRLWRAKSKKDFDFDYFSLGEYLKAVEEKVDIESISYVLYPDDNNYKNKVLRLKQQYFLVSASIQSIINEYKKSNKINSFHEKIAIHINDTHPTLAIPELMRILIDYEGLSWQEAWHITVNTISYTNHTIMPEALEKWPLHMVKELLPRVYMIIEEINKRFYERVLREKGEQKAKNIAIIFNNEINMTKLAIVGSHSVNGVAKLHTNILKSEVMRDFYDIYPERFNNKTNGITHRRFLLKSNTKLSNLISESIGDCWIKSPKELKKLESFAEDKSFCEKLQCIKKENKIELSKIIKDSTGITVDENSIFDVQIKRFHLYKRQLLNVLNIIYMYNEVLQNRDVFPRTFIFSGKAARGYYEAKQVIKLINALGEKINKDSRVKDKIKVVFLENYRVSLSERIFPAADVSEQISTASKEASGTGNMKFMMNGAITLGTLDGANVEILEAVGKENIVTFGLKAEEVLNYYKNRNYNPFEVYNREPIIKNSVDKLVNGFLDINRDEFKVLYNELLRRDEYFVLKDFMEYIKAQKKIEQLYKNTNVWNKISITNIANSARFSSDRTIKEYAKEIWNIENIK